MTPPLCLALLTALAAGTASGADFLVYIGTRAEDPAAGLTLAHFDTETGALRPAGLAARSPMPVFSTLHPGGRLLYVCNYSNAFDGPSSGGVSAFAIDPAAGCITLLNTVPSAGNGAAYVSLDRTGRFLFEVNYRSGNLAAFALEPDGRIGARTALLQHSGNGPVASRQEKAHPHSIQASPDNRFALVPDLGADRVFIYRFDAEKGTLTPHDPAGISLPPGAGPRHFAWHPDGRHLYLLSELSNTVTGFHWDPAAGTLAPYQTVPTLAPGSVGTNTAAEILVHPGGRFLYASNRGADNSIAVFAIDCGDARLSLVEKVPSGGRFPRNLAFVPGGRWLLSTNHESDCVVVFAIDPATGRLTLTGAPVPFPSPHGIAIVPRQPVRANEG